MIQNLELISFEQISECWNLAFSDYIVPMHMTPAGAEAYFRLVGADRHCSFAALHEGEIIGLIINAIDIIDKNVIGYDAMTGIVLQHRGKGVFTQLFEHTRRCLLSSGITQYFLEVITTNERALNIYQGKGGKIVRELTFMKGTFSGKQQSDATIEVSPLAVDETENVSLYQPAYSNRTAALSRNHANYSIVSAKYGSGNASAIVSNRGVICQVRYERVEDLQSIILYLSNVHGVLSFSNLPLSETELVSWLSSVGFETMLHQYEMCIEL